MVHAAGVSPNHRQSNADQNAVLAVSDLSPGSWLVAATAPPSWEPPLPRGDEPLQWALTFYPGVTDPQLAEAVTLRPGSEQSGTEILETAAKIALHTRRGLITLFRSLGEQL
jgi:hypothetical protein